MIDCISYNPMTVNVHAVVTTSVIRMHFQSFETVHEQLIALISYPYSLYDIHPLILQLLDQKWSEHTKTQLIPPS